MKNLIIFILNLFKSLILTNRNFVRLNPNYSGKIFFYNKKKKKFFFVNSRSKVDSITIDQIYTYEDYRLDFLIRHKELVHTYEKILNSNKIPLIIDCGANIGISPKYFAEEFPSSKIIAIEPDSENVKIMEINCKDKENIIIEECSVGSINGFSKIINKGDDFNRYRTKRINEKNGLKVITINQIYSDYSQLVPFIVKIDIEGFEKDLFKSNTEWVRKTPLIIIEMHDWMLPKEGNSNNFLKSISSESRDFIYRGENIFSISNSI